MPLLPYLIIARQKIDAIKLREKRSDAAARGAEKRAEKRKANKPKAA